MKIDLHCHSTHSDGKETLSEIFQYASEAGLDVLAITDHDTVAGWPEARQLASEYGITFVPGIEVTTSHHDVSVHMLAYLPDPNYEPLISRLSEVREARATRIERYVENLRREEKFRSLTLAAVLAEVSKEGDTVGRPHIADAMVTLKMVNHRDDAFAGPLDKNSDHHVASPGIPTIEAIRLIRAAGGVPVMAHPMARAGDDLVITPTHRERFTQLIQAGLAGFEINHREVGIVARNWLQGLADEFDLIVTGSSDYHGILGKKNRLGERTTTLEMLKRIEAEATGSTIQWA